MLEQRSHIYAQHAPSAGAKKQGLQIQDVGCVYMENEEQRSDHQSAKHYTVMTMHTALVEVLARAENSARDKLEN
jgi:hypothetical protein